MIVYIFRTLWAALPVCRKPTMQVLESSVYKQRVWPWDVDLNGHLNNGCYLTLMDYSRVRHGALSGWLLPMIKRRAWPLVALSTMRYFKGIDAFHSVKIHTQIVCWDDKWFYIEQRFIKPNGDLAALGMVKALVSGRKGPISSAVALSWAGDVPPAPALPRHFVTWLKTESEAIEMLKKERE